MQSDRAFTPTLEQVNAWLNIYRTSPDGYLKYESEIKIKQHFGEFGIRCAEQYVQQIELQNE